MIRSLSIALFLCFTTFNSALADDSQADCNSTCPSGKVMSSFADGDDVTCLCVEAATMDPTVADPEVPTGEDSNNTH